MLVFCQPRSFGKCCLEGPQLFFLNPVIQWLFSVSRISPSFCFKIPDRGLQIRQILDNKKPLGSSLFRVGQWCCQFVASRTYSDSSSWSSNLYTEQLKFVSPISVISSLILMLQQTNYKFLTGLAGNEKFAACLLDQHATDCSTIKYLHKKLSRS